MGETWEIWGDMGRAYQAMEERAQAGRAQAEARTGGRARTRGGVVEAGTGGGEQGGGRH